MKFSVSEIFYSLQGEGPASGVPCVFLRFSGCNLRCQWGKNLCDTPYTSWEPEGVTMSADEIIASLKPQLSKTKILVITGGEPTLQVDLASLSKTLKAQGWILHLETNGTGPIPDEFSLVVCSPKLSDSTPIDLKLAKRHDQERKNFDPSLLTLGQRLYLKFVCASGTSIDEVREIVERLQVPAERVYLMPEGVSTAQISAGLATLWPIASENGFCLSSRMHVLAFGNRRAV